MIGQLIKITTVPIAVEMKTQPARLERKSVPPSVNISRSKGGLNLSSKAPKVKIDSFEAKNELVPTAMRSIENAAKNGKAAVQDFMAKAADNARAYMDAPLGEDAIGNVVRNENEPKELTSNIKAWPSHEARVKTSFDEGRLDIAYSMDKLKFDVRLDKGELEYIPGKIDFEITQYPDIKIEYTGGPIYVPPRKEDE